MKRLVVVAVVLLAGLAILQVQMNRNFPPEKSYDEEKQAQQAQQEATKANEFGAKLNSTLVTWADAKKAKGPIVKSKSGLQYIDIKAGTGDVCRPRDKVAINYAGFLQNGKEFDASYKGKGSKATVFSLTQVVPGFREGVSGMKVGGRRKLILPPKIAYGKKGVGPIPPNATLIFVVDLLDLKHDTRDE